MEKKIAELLTQGRSGTHWLTQVRGYPAASGPLVVQLVARVEKGLSEMPSTGMVD